MLENIIATLVVAAILGGAIFYIVRARKKGIKCIGCPDSKTCSGSCSGCSGNCSAHKNNHQGH